MVTAPPPCLNCRAPLLPDTGFCSACGTPTGQRAAAAGLPPSPPLPAGFAGGASRTVHLALTPADAPRALADALRAGGATVTGGSAGVVAFAATRRGKRSLGLAVRYRGVTDIAPDGGGTAVTLRAKPEPASVAVVAILVTGLMLGVTLLGNGGQLFPNGADNLPDAYNAGKSSSVLLFFGGFGVGLPWWLLTRASRHVVEVLVAAIAARAGGGGAAAMAPAGGWAPSPTDGIFAQLRELGTLRDQGVIDDAEHDQARAALLAKLA